MPSDLDARRSLRALMHAYSLGKRYLKDRSANSVLYCHMPRRWASGEKISRVSRAIEARLWSGMYCSVRML
jgi:hypothetical protein